ncbi:MAG: hypothetical protein WA020_06930, partial [Candidatus Acidiferrales bacterium]
LSSPAAAGGAATSAPSVDAKFIAIDENPESTPKSAPTDKDADPKTADNLRDTLHDYAATLSAAKFPYSFPGSESGKILLRGVLACSAATQPSCTFTAFPAEQTLRIALASSASDSSQ